MQRILILGSGGAGKSTLANQIQQITALPIIHLDEHYWNANWQPTATPIWEEKVKVLTQQEAWIMDGNYGGTLELRLQRADAVVFLEMPRLLCIQRVLFRTIRHYKKTRPSLHPNCPERFSWEFIRYLWNYPNKNGPNALKKVQKSKVPLFQLKNKAQIKAFLGFLAKNQPQTLL